MESYTVTQASEYLRVSASTVRVWTKEFGDYLSEVATVKKGRERRYTKDDLAALETVAVLRNGHQPYDDIRERLEDGERLELPAIVENAPQLPPRSEQTQTTALAPMDLLERVIKPYEDQIELLTNERDYLRDQLDKERARANRPWYRRLFGRD